MNTQVNCFQRWKEQVEKLSTINLMLGHTCTTLPSRVSSSGEFQISRESQSITGKVLSYIVLMQPRTMEDLGVL